MGLNGVVLPFGNEPHCLTASSTSHFCNKGVLARVYGNQLHAINVNPYSAPWSW